MRGVGRHRQVAALDLVLALRAGLDARQPCSIAKSMARVVAELEMQEGHVHHRSPSCGRTAPRAPAGSARRPPARHRARPPSAPRGRPAPRPAAARSARQVGAAAPLLVGGAAIEAMEGVPVAFGVISAPRSVFSTSARGRGIAPLAPQRLALARRPARRGNRRSSHSPGSASGTACRCAAASRPRPAPPIPPRCRR